MACLPFQQVDTEFIEHGAGDLAAVLGVDEAIAGWGMVRAWTWCISRQWEREPPDGIIPGPSADRLLERAAGWSGTPGAFVAGLLDPAVNLAERLDDGGLRLRGTDRYREAWENQRKERQRWADRRKKGKPEAASSEATPPEHRRSTAGAPPEHREDSSGAPVEHQRSTTRKMRDENERRIEDSQVREAQETTSRVRADEASGRGPSSGRHRGGQHAPPPVASGDSEVERATDEAGLLPHESPPPAEPPLMELLAQDFAAARGAEYGLDRGDDAAMRELLRRGPPAEVRRRWRIGIAVPPGKYGRVSKLSDLVRLWNDCDAAPSTAPPGKPKPRDFKPTDYREGDVPTL